MNILENARHRRQLLRKNESAVEAVCKPAHDAESAMRAALDALFRAPAPTAEHRRAVLDAGTRALAAWEAAVGQWERTFPGVLPPTGLAMVPHCVDDGLDLMDHYDRNRPTA